MITRKHDWPELLHEFLADRRGQEFSWGTNDCCLFACNWVLSCTGVDLAADFRGHYKDQLGAVRIMRKFVGDSAAAEDLVRGVAEKIADQHAIAEVRPALAQRGDVVLFDSKLCGLALGIVGFNHAAHAAGGAVIPADLWIKAWRI